ncbi:MAG: hypothetical protein HRU26_00795, partial [Psychroserpens sp.]|nr:hypothetical protein [Psychroserpens sp.]
MRAFSIATKLSPIGLLIGLIGAAVTAYALFSESTEKAATSQSLLNDAMIEADKNTAETIKRKQLLFEVARDETLSLKQRQEAIDELNKIVPEYNNNLSLETVNTLEAKNALNKHIEAMKQSAIVYALQEKIKKKAVELAELEGSSLEDNIKWYEQLWNGIMSGGQAYSFATRNATTAIENKREAIEATKEEIAVLEELYKTQLRNNPSQSGLGNDGPKEGDEKAIGDKIFVYRNGKWVRKNPFRPSAGGLRKSESVKNAQREANELLKLQRETEDAKIA